MIDEIVGILMKRDGMSREDAQEMVDSFSLRVNSGNENLYALEDEFQDEFGLELDYFIQLLK
jgi:hypothetical protein